MADTSPSITILDTNESPTFYVNEYTLTRAPHANGMWYVAWSFVACHGSFVAENDAHDATDALRPHLAERRSGLIRPGYGAWTSWPDIYVQTHPGVDLPFPA